jgi:hypothetical protein
MWAKGVDALCIKIRMRIQITKGLRRPDHTGHIGEARIRFSDCKIRFSKSRIRFNKALNLLSFYFS